MCCGDSATGLCLAARPLEVRSTTVPDIAREQRGHTKLGKDRDIATTLRMSGPMSVIGDDLAGQGASVIQEAISNAVRHSGATQLTVAVSVAERLEVTITDDGCGISVDKQRHSGLANMASRAQENGGDSCQARSGRSQRAEPGPKRMVRVATTGPWPSAIMPPTQRCLTQPASTSSVHTLKLVNVAGPNVLLSATSAASRPRAINTLPIRGVLLRASKVCHCPPRKTSNQAAKSIGSSRRAHRCHRGIRCSSAPGCSCSGRRRRRGA